MEKITAALVLLILKQGTLVTGFSVTFENPNPCAIKGTSVVFRCTYNYTDGETATKTTWYKGAMKDGIWTRVRLSEFPSYDNRSEYLGDLQYNCSLALHELEANDTGYYYFRLDTDKYGWRSKKSVHLSVTELSATVHPEQTRAGDNVTLSCTTQCQLPSIVWFKEGRPVDKPEFQAQPADSGNYFCALKGQESLRSDAVALDVQYPPLNVSIEVSYPGSLPVGSSVNLTCSSAANPAADNYTWYRRASNPSSWVLVGSGEVLSLQSVEASHSGPYLCQVRNSVGEDKATEVLLIVDRTDINRVILLVGIAVKVIIVVLLPLVIVWAWRNRRKSSANKKEHGHDNEYVSTA
ncbi:hypothetical protein Q5P01_010901 [Channa striata]|uniref:Ig-like domain-containing protein n=1 Tax=Channa striata TaxID=64152 RepID=A0AA88SQ52_CHASR|nr:hypothetical protein Q5P01_010901 [Channa striata]